MLNTLKQTNFPLYIATLFSIYMWEDEIEEDPTPMVEEDPTPMASDRTDEFGIPSYE